MVAVPKVDSDGLLLGNEELQKAISMGLLDTALILGWEPEDTFDGDDEVLFSERCTLFRARDSKWRKVAEGCAELLLNKYTRKVRFGMRHEDGYSFVASFFAVCAPPFGVLLPLRSTGWKFSSSIVLRTIPKFNMLPWTLLLLCSLVSSKMHFWRLTG